MLELLNQGLMLLVRLYRRTLSPLLVFLFPGAGCRFDPTCSTYALEALRSHGPLRGSWLTIKRLARCHPWGGCGHDPVPPLKRAAGVPPADQPLRRVSAATRAGAPVAMTGGSGRARAETMHATSL